MSDSLYDACVSEAPAEGENQVQVHETIFDISGFYMLLAEMSERNNKTKQMSAPHEHMWHRGTSLMQIYSRLQSKSVFQSECHDFTSLTFLF